MATEVLPDERQLRYGRRQRALVAMEEHNLDMLILGRPANIRYVTGVPQLWNAGTRAFGPGCVLVRGTGEIRLLSTWDEGVPDEIPHDHLYGITWNPMNLVSVLHGIGDELRPRRVGTDALSPLFAQLLPLALPDSDLVDGERALQQARQVKTAEEIAAIRSAIGVAEAGLAASVADLRPGITERELAAIFMDAMASCGVTTPSTQDVARITTRPHRAAGEPAREGDLVAFDAGVVAGGYTGEVGRTWPVGTESTTPSTRDLYRRWHELWSRMEDACQPGARLSALFGAYEAAGEPVPAAPIAWGVGLGLDQPLVVRDLPATAERDRFDPGMVLVVRAHAADDDGAVTGTQTLLVTPTGPEVLTSSPQWSPERG
jgi:Xaa-Pro aminopeptidase